MSIRSHRPSSLKLETLELRMLLAGMDTLAELQAEVAQALSLLGTEGEYTHEISHPRANGERMLTIVGPGYGALSVDFTLLSDVFTTVRVSSFDTVEFKGNDSLNNLIASDLKALSAPGITVSSLLDTYMVDDVVLNAVGDTAKMKGDTTRLTVNVPTSTFILTDLAQLSITTPQVGSSEIPFYYAFTNPHNHTIVNGRTIHGTALPGPGGSPGGSAGSGDGGFTEEIINNVVFVSPLALRGNPLFEEFKAFVAKGGEVDLQRGIIELLSLTPKVGGDTPLLLTELANRDHQFSISDEPYSSPAIASDLANPLPRQINLDLPAAAFERPAWMHRDLIPSEELEPLDDFVDHAGQLMLDLESGEVPWPLLHPIVPAAPLAEGALGRTFIDQDALEQIRHHIAEVVANSETKAVTMSEYVVERVTREFSPGHTRTLLVEQKPPLRSLSERESQEFLI